MKTIFTRGPSYSIRLGIVLALAIFLFFADSKFNLFSSVRVYLNSFVSPLQYIADVPQQLSKTISQYIWTRKALQKRNFDLEKKNLALSADKQFLLQLQNENKALRSLLNSKKTFINKRMITEVIRVRSDPFKYQLLINKGKNDGVYIGQPVTSTLGLVGQISQVGNTTSRVLLIVDSSHGVPVRVRRNGLIANVHGSGDWNKLDIPFIQSTADLKVGDVLETSALGGVFPAGYPVAIVSHFAYVKGELYADASAKPIAKLDKSRYLLLLWPYKDNLKKKVDLNDAKLP
ncbi:MAG: rod shape-determining protein MreC [Psychromonas sp.]|nr:rod shape-determining protein MreC [Psychromonas sp.]